MKHSKPFSGRRRRTYLPCASLLFLICPATSRTQEATEPHPKPGSASSSVYWQLFQGCDSDEPCTRKENFQVAPLPSGSCVLTVRNGDGVGTDEARSYEIFLNSERVIPMHRSGNARVNVKVLGKNTLKVVLTGEIFRKVFIEILCDAQVDRTSTKGQLTEQLSETIMNARMGGTPTIQYEAAQHLAELTRTLNPNVVDDETIADMMSLLDVPILRNWAAVSLGNLGPRASIAVPKLQKILPEEDCHQVSHSAAGGIRYALTQMGIKPLPPKCE